jgi:hypothetical protein
MAFRVFGDERDEDDITVVNDNGDVVTTAKRQEALFAEGNRFEAAVAQAAMVEGLLLHYLLVKKQVDLVQFDQATLDRLVAERLTFGEVKDALVRAKETLIYQLCLSVRRFT